jgi:hypothetical protein
MTQPASQPVGFCTPKIKNQSESVGQLISSNMMAIG